MYCELLHSISHLPCKQKKLSAWLLTFLDIWFCTQVEILLPEFWDPASGPVFAEEGDQQRFWKLTRRFIDSLAQGRNSKNIKAVSSSLCKPLSLHDQHEDNGFDANT